MSFVVTLALVALAVGLSYVHAWRKKNRLAANTWDGLVRQLDDLPMFGITKVALDFLQPSKGQLRIPTEDLWLLVGGVKGLKRMQRNAEVLLQLAAFAQQWNLEESIIVGERMRRDGLQLRRAVHKIEMGLLLGLGKTTGPFCVQEAAGAYYLMRQRLLALYESSHVGRLSHLTNVLGATPATF